VVLLKRTSSGKHRTLSSIVGPALITTLQLYNCYSLSSRGCGKRRKHDLRVHQLCCSHVHTTSSSWTSLLYHKPNSTLRSLVLHRCVHFHIATRLHGASRT